jgi:outer membrane protein OmpA-like peptidoglycan-associated protein
MKYSMKRLKLVAISAVLAGCAGTILPSAEQSLPSTKRITDRAIFADQKEMQALQDGLAVLNQQKSVALDSYLNAKTQCWLDVAAHEYHRNDRSGFIEKALAKTREGLADMDAGRTSSDAQATETKYCSQAERACAEVRQAHADHEEAQFGWRHARPYHAIAQDLGRQAKVKEQSCVIAKAAESAPVVVAAPAPIASPPVIAPPAPVAIAPLPAPAPVIITKLVMLSDTLFAFNRFEVQDLSSHGKARLADLAQRISGIPAAEASRYTVKITGFADRLGHASYNAQLSEKRAQTVRDQLRLAGVGGVQMVTAAGPWNASADSCKALDRKQEIACLATDRRVEIEVTRQ